jgi:Gpi18-like mannosyltransferase
LISADDRTDASDPADRGPVRRADRPWRRAFGTAASVWAAASIGYFLINGMTWMMLRQTGPRLGGALDVWDQWDTGHYIQIALFGYKNVAAESPAFFPLYPLMVRYLEPVLPGGGLSAGLIISHAACLGALTILFRLVEDLFDVALARRTVVFLMAYPFAFFLVTAYNEAVFLFLSVAAFYLMRRGNWWAAGAIGALASATRQAGVLLAVAFAVEYLRQRDWRWREIRADALAVCVIPLGMASYAVWCWLAFGDPLYFLSVQSMWGREPRFPWEGSASAVWQIIDATRGNGAIFQPIVVFNIIDLLAVLVTGTLLVLSIVGPWRLGRESAYLIATAVVGFVVILISPIARNVPLHGVPRYVLEMLPAFMVLARIGAKPHLERLYLFPALLTQGVIVLAFYFDYFVA